MPQLYIAAWQPSRARVNHSRDGYNGVMKLLPSEVDPSRRRCLFWCIVAIALLWLLVTLTI